MTSSLPASFLGFFQTPSWVQTVRVYLSSRRRPGARSSCCARPPRKRDSLLGSGINVRDINFEAHRPPNLFRSITRRAQVIGSQGQTPRLPRSPSRCDAPALSSRPSPRTRRSLRSTDVVASRGRTCLVRVPTFFACLPPADRQSWLYHAFLLLVGAVDAAGAAPHRHRAPSLSLTPSSSKPPAQRMPLA